MMKFGLIFLICALLLINFQLSGSVKCWVKEKKECLGLECSSCVGYSCLDLVEGTRKRGYGCPEDFFRDCSTQKEIVDFIKSKNYNDFVYGNSEVLYFSGCSNKCVKKKFGQSWPDNVTQICNEAGIPCNYNADTSTALPGYSPTDEPSSDVGLAANYNYSCTCDAAAEEDGTDDSYYLYGVLGFIVGSLSTVIVILYH